MSAMSSKTYTSLRSAVETLQYARTDEQRARLNTIVKDDVRMSRPADHRHCRCLAPRCRARAPRQVGRPGAALRTLVDFANETKKDSAPHIRLEVVRPPYGLDQPFTILGHDNRLGQVVRNLVDNAASFSPPGSTAAGRRRLARQVEFRVDDEGPGINPDQMARIFDRLH